tara:strand:+ start:45713 stop:45817 length:105 start_codon:yes stop_codon:yes gene_type:complete
MYRQEPSEDLNFDDFFERFAMNDFTDKMYEFKDK